MKIDRFKAQVNSMARTNRFNLAMFGTGGAVSGLRMRGLHCTTAVMPGRGFMTKTPIDYGPRRTVPTMPQYDAFDCTFRLENHYEDRELLEKWQEAVFSPAPDFYMNYLDDYKGISYLEQVDHYSQVTYRGVMVDAWPMQIGVSTFSADSNNEIQTVTGQFNYRFWFSEFTNSKPDTFLGGILQKFGKKLGRKITSKLEDVVF